MKRALAVAAAIVQLAGTAAAADYAVTDRGEDYALCAGVYTSPLLSIADTAQLQAEVTHRYDRAVQVSMNPRAVNADSTLFTWATEASVACGKALGFFADRQIDGAQISQCDCYYQRMSRRLR